MNIDDRTVRGFGAEWQRFDQTAVDDGELRAMFDQYFAVFPWDAVSADAVGFDMGCGSGRWARLVAPRVGQLHCIDASAAALDVARRTLADVDNCTFHAASVDQLPLAAGSMDFGYSLGVLHHVPDPLDGLRACVDKLKGGAPFLVYLYYAFDNRPAWFRAVWKASDLLRRWISAAPEPLRYTASQLLALAVYWPLARAARLAERRGRTVENWPLAVYRDRSFYAMRTDALDRFGTNLEHRFTADEVRALMTAAGLSDVVVSDSVPYWCAVGFRRAEPGLR